MLRRMTIFLKLILTFLVAIVPLFVVSLQFNRMGAESVRKEIWGSMETRLRFERSELLNMNMALYMPEEQVLGPLNQYRTWF
ncbi:hypothetical protein [Paenibacillus nasutitermitis]|uniref:Uncharacterized protein n=1 Tax=Paenibacillus nasutitermitis TaxID=1652958 RepID=A0A916YMI7_9BACL|nr:hypothetical protein [Paenibacillus nasutitermitis]GGD52048.1 hypothetical protein GCM10010911_06970 [Paenibacillus nasutitermitis]